MLILRKGQSALILGATGAVGKNLLRELLDSSHFTRVGEFGRRTTALDTDGLNNKEKLVQKVVDFEKLREAGFTDEKWDVVFIASVHTELLERPRIDICGYRMGTTRKQAGSMEKFFKIDQESEPAPEIWFGRALTYGSLGML